MRSVVVLVCVALTSLGADAADLKIRDQVFLKVAVRAKVGDAAADPDLMFTPATVRAMDGERLWVAQRWVHRDDVMSLSEAKRFYDERVKVQPSNPQSWFYRGSVHTELRDFELAHEDYTEAIRLEPTSAITFAVRADNWTQRRELNRALTDFEEAFRLDPKCILAFVCRGAAWYQQKDYDKALADFNEAVRLNSNVGYVYEWRGLTWLFKGLNDLAIADFNRALQVDPNNYAPYTYRACAWHYKRNYSNAIADYEHVLQLAPNDSDSHSGLAWIRATCSIDRFRNGAKAVEHGLIACELSQWVDPNSVCALAAAYAEAEAWDDAVATQERYIKLVVNDLSQEDGQYELDLYERGIPYRERLTFRESLQVYFWQIIIGLISTLGTFVLVRKAIQRARAVGVPRRLEAGGANEVVTVNLKGKNLGELGLRQLRGMTRLRRLSLAETDVTDSRLEELQGLSSLTVLNLARTQIGDRGLEKLSRLRALQSVDLSETDISDRGLEPLMQLPHLQELDLSGTQIGDEGLLHLIRCAGLTRLDLSSTRVTDAGLEAVHNLTSLTELWLGDTDTTSEGRAQLRAALPGCKVEPIP